jgi:hypothetical protein
MERKLEKIRYLCGETERVTERKKEILSKIDRKKELERNMGSKREVQI